MQNDKANRATNCVYLIQTKTGIALEVNMSHPNLI